MKMKITESSMLKKLILLVVIVLICQNVQAETFGIGVILGEPTGISAKLWIGDQMAIDLAAAWSFAKEGAFQLHADYLFHLMELIKVSEGKLPLYFGVGGRMKFGEDNLFSVRIPVGLAYLFENVPLDVFLEVGPMLNLVPATEFDIGGGIGVRYFF
jgi:hypothetical protein